jgi:hypothetical protein
VGQFRRIDTAIRGRGQELAAVTEEPERAGNECCRDRNDQEVEGEFANRGSEIRNHATDQRDRRGELRAAAHKGADGLQSAGA